VLTRVENDGNMTDTRVSRQVGASVKIIILYSVFLCILIHWVETPLPLILYAKGGRVYMDDPSRL
jgi:hypothetical protein